MKVFVTGGAGYIGSHTIRRLREKRHDVTVYDNLSTGHDWLVRGYPLVVSDLRDADALRNALPGHDAIVHFAACAYVGESVEHPRKYFNNNVVGGLSLLDAALEAGVRNVVFSSTCATYGTPTRIPITEDEPQVPINPYGHSKLFFEKALASYSHAYGIRHVSLRYFNAAGADPSGEIGEIHVPEPHLIPLACSAAHDEVSHLNIFGADYPTPDGTCIRDYIHVNDLADAHVLALEYLESGGDSVALNLGMGRGYSVREVVAATEQVSGRAVPVQIANRRRGDPAELVADPTRAQTVLNWKARRTFEEIIRSAWQWSCTFSERKMREQVT
jgi:UDP-arabinose 4-epimerase